MESFILYLVYSRLYFVLYATSRTVCWNGYGIWFTDSTATTGHSDCQSFLELQGSPWHHKEMSYCRQAVLGRSARRRFLSGCSLHPILDLQLCLLTLKHPSEDRIVYFCCNQMSIQNTLKTSLETSSVVHPPKLIRHHCQVGLLAGTEWTLCFYTLINKLFIFSSKPKPKPKHNNQPFPFFLF